MDTLSNNKAMLNAFDCSKNSVRSIVRATRSSAHVLQSHEVERRLRHYGHNEIAHTAHRTWYCHLGELIRDPLNVLLGALCALSYFTGNSESDVISRPQKWDIGAMKRFILCMGPISSLFDYLTFGLMLFVFNAWLNPTLFHTVWFVESLLSQTLIIHIIRTKKIPFIQSNASLPLILATIGVIAVGIGLPFSPYASALGFTALPPAYWLYIAAMLIAYGIITQMMKMWFFRRYA